ncbi:protein phosphatase 2C domain protein [Desulforamulus reducens MI-1]|uniref:Protein phosphatase 2C domain protein n=1 Tax=Desulforamulus reducens (strain ATCC BAA-1160 / DSM 100696 / MI-1) TaxID=349161 RepID=A4J585_DESRM|nr:Stp1/IreP family PP2C-type Ser/Thr phosphatase [Desulforamulus reducens]ABO50238.1 protein phosphatase 2C domain protein [Desulforamulus reducens MI-1]
MKWSQISDVGRVRPGNEDSMCACPDIGLFAVADGMGGHKAGEIASRTVIEYLVENLRNSNVEKEDIATNLLRILDEANLRIHRLSNEIEEYRGMGTTVTAGIFVDNKLIIAHVGDSRAYLIRHDDIIQITNDHSLVGEMLRCGGITEEQAINHPQKNVLTRAMGTAPMVRLDLHTVDLKVGDKILFCTDGLINHLRPEEIKHVIKGQPDLDKCLEELMDLTLERGGTDNSTIVLVEVE